MCNCKSDLKFNTYKNQVTIPRIDMPLHMQQYVTKDAICIDRCILWELFKLWSYGITTTWCCCGHNVENGVIGVISDNVPIMFRLGYARSFNPHHNGVQSDFYAKSVERIKQ
jgi:hypothetical protein